MTVPYKILQVALILFSIFLISCVATFAQPQKLTYHIGDLVQGNDYGIKVVNVKKVNSFMHSGLPLKYTYPDKPEHILLQIEVVYFEHGAEVLTSSRENVGNKLKENSLNLSVIDSNAKEHTEIDHPTTISSDGRVWNYVTLFSVPKDSMGFKLKYRNLPLIDLGL